MSSSIKYQQYNGHKIESSLNNVETELAISGRPTKFRIRRDDEMVYVYYMYSSTWYLVASYDYTGITDDIGETLEIRVHNNDFISGYGTLDNLLIIQPPETPENLVVTPGVQKNIISWDDSTAADSYNLYWDTTSGIDSTSATKIEGVTSPYEHIDLTPNQLYYYTIAAEDGDYESNLSEEQSGIPTDVYVPDPESESGINNVVVSWSDTTAEIDSYNIYWDTMPGVDSTSGIKIENVESPYNIYIPLPGEDPPDGWIEDDRGDWEDQWSVDEEGIETVTIYIIVTAVSEEVESDESEEISGSSTYTIPDNTILIGTTSNPQGDVYGLVIPDTTSGIEEITITWEDIDLATSYNLYWSTTPGLDSTSATKIESVTSPYTHTSLSPGTIHYYAITAENDSGESDFSYEVNETTYPAIPTGVDSTAGMEEITTSWDTVISADSYNVYWKKDKCPNCYFYDLDDWTQSISNGTISLVGGAVKLNITDGQDGHAIIRNKYSIPQGDFVLDIDIVDYFADAEGTSDALDCFIMIHNNNFDNRFYIYYNHEANYVSHIAYKYNGGSIVHGSDQNIGSEPSKLRITRAGNILYGYIYTGSWVLIGQYDFGIYSSDIDILALYAIDKYTRGGYVVFDNFIVTPSVKDSGTKISDIDALTYDHESLIPGDVYCYEVTAENISGESEASEETFNIPLVGLSDPPTGIDMTSGEEYNVISFITDPEADETHIYWATTPGVSPITGTKISDITSPYIHSNLHPDPTYYYILASENEYGEGDPSAEYNSSPTPEAPAYIDTTSEIESIIISWIDSTGADSYNIYWRENPGVTKINSTKITGVVSPYTHPSLTPGQTYYYVIASEDEDGESAVSYEVNNFPDIDLPRNPDALSIGDVEISISWDSVIGATAYDIYWSKSPGVTSDTGTKIEDISSPHAHSGLDSDDTYYYVIVARNTLSESEDSSEVSAIAYDIPEAPYGIDATASSLSVIITWDELEHIDSYNIYWSDTPGVDSTSGNLIASATSPYTHVTPSHEIPFYYVITAINNLHESPESDEVSAIPYITFHVIEQKRTIDGFGFDGHSDILNRFRTMFNYNEDLILFPNQSFSLTTDSTHEITIGKGICMKDNTIVHVQQTYTIDFSNNDYYIDSTGDMNEEGYYYIVLKYNKIPITPASKLSYHIIRDISLYNEDDYMFLGVAKISYLSEYIVDEVYTRDPDTGVSRPTIPDEDWMLMEAGEL